MEAAYPADEGRAPQGARGLKSESALIEGEAERVAPRKGRVG